MILSAIAGDAIIIMDRKQRIDHYVQRLSDKKFQIYDVRLELEQQKVDEEEIKFIVRAVDEELQNRLLSAQSRDQSTMFVRLGIILMVVGTAITVAFVTDALKTKSFMFLTYGPFIIGVSMLLVGLFKRRNKNSRKFAAPTVDDSKQRKDISFRRNPD